MNTSSHNSIVRSLTDVPSRRDVIGGMAAVALGLGAMWPPQTVRAGTKRKQKRRHKPAAPNAFGCIDVGKVCRNADRCCSGICKGKKGRKRCQAHGGGTCDQREDGLCEAANPADVPCNGIASCLCLRTTGGSNFCGNPNAVSGCEECARDADCEALGYPAGAACVPLSDGNCSELCPATGTACFSPCLSPPF